MTNATVLPYSLLTDFDVSLFAAGKHYKLYEKFGSHALIKDGKEGVYFAVWAPGAASVTVMGSFNGWNPYIHPLFVRWDHSGIWEGFIPGAKTGDLYKYRIETAQGALLDKCDPFALQQELPPRTASVIGTTWYEWKDSQWMQNRHQYNGLNQPMSVYEMHLGSWIRDPEQPQRLLGYREIAKTLVDYITKAGFTHVEFMPLMEHPYYPSWGYQITGYFAASARYGPPQDLMCLIECLHQAGIGVIMDWVPAHFPGDAHGLHQFDGTALYEHADPKMGFHPDWGTYIFNYGRNEVRSFLISNAVFWLDRYHIDGLRVDAVASMLYLDYSREEGEWIPNEHGGRENLEAISFLKEMNEAVYGLFPDIQTIAEESTSWPGVSRPVYAGGLGFGMKWMMGWMNDTLGYFARDPLYRKHHHGQLTFSTVYAFHENFMLPFSHDEMVHGKGSMLQKMPGDEWQRMANLRAMYLYMFTHSGTKLLFMGAEFGQIAEWNMNQSLDWHLLGNPAHEGLFRFVQALNHLYKNTPALYEISFRPEGFTWVEGGDAEQSVIAYLRKGLEPEEEVLVILNLTPIVRYSYRCGLPGAGLWSVILNSDAHAFGGTGVGSNDVHAEPTRWMQQEWSALLTLPPLGGLVLQRKVQNRRLDAEEKINL
jgi:1,4-alpha-glucan branching enzyme